MHVPGDASAVVRLMHQNLTDLEIATIEVCAAAILDFSDIPWAMTVDLARQIADEARHARLFWRGLEARGGRLGAAPTSMALWEMFRGRDLPLRLALHQCVGELIGVGGALYHANRMRDDGDEDGSALFGFVAADEVTHVALGNRWLQRLVPDPSARSAVFDEARAVRAAAGRSTD